MVEELRTCVDACNTWTSTLFSGKDSVLVPPNSKFSNSTMFPSDASLSEVVELLKKCANNAGFYLETSGSKRLKGRDNVDRVVYLNCSHGINLRIASSRKSKRQTSTNRRSKGETKCPFYISLKHFTNLDRWCISFIGEQHLGHSRISASSITRSLTQEQKETALFLHENGTPSSVTAALLTSQCDLAEYLTNRKQINNLITHRSSHSHTCSELLGHIELHKNIEHIVWETPIRDELQPAGRATRYSKMVRGDLAIG